MFSQQGLPKSVLPKIPEKSADVKLAPHVLSEGDINEQSVDVKTAPHFLSKRDIPDDEFGDQTRILAPQGEVMMPLFQNFHVLNNPKEEADNIPVKMHYPR